MTNYAAHAQELRSLLGLDTPPIAMAFMNQAPEAVATTTLISPSSCAFWPLAEESVFYATAQHHHNCQIGAMVMGFELPPSVMEEIGGLVKAMCDCDYLAPEESDKIPSVGRGAAGVLYGPLAAFPAVADAILFWLTPAQAMVYQEAIGSASWASPPTRTGGRPGCAAIPMAMNDGRAVLSLGCKGMRTFTEVADDRMLAVVPGGKFGEFLEVLRVATSSNSDMAQYYNKRKAEVAAIASPAA